MAELVCTVTNKSKNATEYNIAALHQLLVRQYPLSIEQRNNKKHSAALENVRGTNNDELTVSY